MPGEPSVIRDSWQNESLEGILSRLHKPAAQTFEPVRIRSEFCDVNQNFGNSVPLDSEVTLSSSELKSPVPLITFVNL